jgi:uncharacterized membrane protein YhiD involved in acid resistance
MDTVFEALLFLSIGLIAITVTVFVLAVSLLGRAIKLSLQEQTETEEKVKIETEKEIKKIQGKLKISKTGRVDVDKLRSELKILEKQQKEHKRKLNWIKSKPALLKVNGGVLLPGTFFLISIIFIVIARYFLSQDTNYNVVGYSVGAIAFIILGIFILIQSLKVIESVAITSDETSLTRETEAVKQALLEVEEANRPEFKVEFKNHTFPLSIEKNTEIELNMDLNLTKSYVAEYVEVHLGLPNTFGFPGSTANALPPDHIYANYLFIKWELPIVKRGLTYHNTIKIKAPNIAGKYRMFFYKVCKGAWSIGPDEYEIIIT